MGRRLQLVAVVQVERHQHLFQRGQRLARPDRSLAERLQPDAAHLDLVLEHGDGVGAVVPQRRQRVRSARRARVLVGEEAEAAAQAGAHHRVERLRLFVRFTKLAIEPADGESVILTNADGIGVREIQPSVCRNVNERRWIIHHAGAPVGAGDEVVRQPQRVAHLVRGELADARQGQLDRVVALSDLGQIVEARAAGQVTVATRGRVGRDEAGSQQVVLPQPQAPQVDVPLEDLAGARIDHRGAVRPAAGGAVRPVYHVVAQIHRICAFR